MSAGATVSLKDHLREWQTVVDARLEQLLPPPEARPESLHRAMRHSVFAGGKRIRPILCLESAAAVRGQQGPQTAGLGSGQDGTLDVACALEMIHTYSLIHDDLPALDNDDFRRGHPTCHKAFGEAIAILAGDALLTYAFEILAFRGELPADRRIAIISEIARSAGSIEGMIGGQVVDVESERHSVPAETVEYIHRSKTGAMIRAAVRVGALAAGATAEQYAALSEYGRHAGLAFQIVDDILDVEASTQELGKTAGKDAEQQKATYPSVYGLERSRELAAAEVESALRALERFDERARWLREIAVYLGQRKN
jgi:geranylgeranyl diphosphate synthase type II